MPSSASPLEGPFPALGGLLGVSPPCSGSPRSIPPSSSLSPSKKEKRRRRAGSVQPCPARPPAASPLEEGEGEEEEEDALQLALDHLSILAREEEEMGGLELEPPGYGALAGGGGGGGFALLEPLEGGSPRGELFAAFPGSLLGGPPPHLLLAAPPTPPLGTIGSRKRSVNTTECVTVPSSEHVAEIVGRQGCKIKALRAKTNTYIKTPVRGEEPVFIVTGRKEDVEMAKREILSAAEHFSMIRATRNKVNGVSGTVLGPPNLPGQTTIQVRVPYRVVGLVVGPKGATIKRIQQQTHTYIVTPSREKEPIFEVTGMPENVDRAREEIEAHITMRTGSFVDISSDNDFHTNGTDVCLDLLGGAGSGPSSLWVKAPNPARRSLSSVRSDNLGSLGNATSVTEPYFGGPAADGPSGSPFGAGNSFSFGEPPAAVLGADDPDFGFDFLALDITAPTTIWSPFEPPGNPLPAFGCPSSLNGNSQRRNSSLSSTATPRHSPTLPETGMPLEHPLARRIQSDPVSTLPWLPTQGSLSSFSDSTGYSSSSSLPSSVSAASGSPTDSSGSDAPRKTSRECMVCFESEVIAALVPCGHNLFCMECAMRICGKPEPECPACHTPATQAIHIFS
ncbi:LOW QUALITY PROTEIN: RNA-binding protein MEX3D-like [Heteronotia binoei]|uniref:LOW QUALITY PROTEIN: RNA-binding protein MEX3D-like n=1 Tax=Heteronotia binoei TaxID=13085 RepID=UPI00292FF3B6|nr:LOW QUALITY PROTEIN: RNA-binding protein MEX3D-like [Heteronotia binoei]